MLQHITSRQNERVKAAAKLRLARQREQQSRFLIDGAREILRALDAGVEFAEAFVCPPLCKSDEAQQAADRAGREAAVAATVTEEVFQKLQFGERGSGVLAIARTPRRTLAELVLPPQPLVAVLVALEKPGNVGAVLRSADGAGVDAVVAADPRCDLFNPNTIRASLGTVFDKNVCTASGAETRAWLASLGVPIFAARPDATVDYAAADYRSGAAVVLGSEAHGLGDEWADADVTGVRLPMRGSADSLNVSATAAVLFYEAQRQRQLAPGH